MFFTKLNRAKTDTRERSSPFWRCLELAQTMFAVQAGGAVRVCRLSFFPTMIRWGTRNGVERVATSGFFTKLDIGGRAECLRNPAGIQMALWGKVPVLLEAVRAKRVLSPGVEKKRSFDLTVRAGLGYRRIKSSRGSVRPYVSINPRRVALEPNRPNHNGDQSRPHESAFFQADGFPAQRERSLRGVCARPY
ncbi:hypothetical protein Dret_1374 [Desulfohalobium retbaense DSM 5692]|uniref:Uncharacterized protein n=1 Tax=Desulfohalobium retbaense (strain ATCC 49708 / DSM 5692 / JCM 16813 / HR100) TaxID=485915 RepID=C8X2L5_DESRD|nr:hypothetical protein Dret_1374 [Desulfohalobium retbaense DSM 5692]